MPLTCWFYVSHSLIPPRAAETEIGRIVEVSRPRNARLAVTGTLIFARGHFAQYLEGTAAGVAALRHSIERDPRHSEVTTLRAEPVAARRFDRWSLAYAGPASYAARAMERTLVESLHGEEHSIGALLDLMTQFVVDGAR